MNHNQGLYLLNIQILAMTKFARLTENTKLGPLFMTNKTRPSNSSKPPLQNNHTKGNLSMQHT